MDSGIQLEEISPGFQAWIFGLRSFLQVVTLKESGVYYIQVYYMRIWPSLWCGLAFLVPLFFRGAIPP